MWKIDFKKTCEMWDTNTLASVCYAKKSRIDFLTAQIASPFTTEQMCEKFRNERRRTKAEHKICEDVLKSRQMKMF